jgi:hypothetical protein
VQKEEQKKEQKRPSEVQGLGALHFSWLLSPHAASTFAQHLPSFCSVLKTILQDDPWAPTTFSFLLLIHFFIFILFIYA